MPKVKVKFSRIVEVEVDNLPETEAEEIEVCLKAEQEINSLIEKGEFFTSDMETEITND